MRSCLVLSVKKEEAQGDQIMIARLTWGAASHDGAPSSPRLAFRSSPYRGSTCTSGQNEMALFSSAIAFGALARVVEVKVGAGRLWTFVAQIPSRRLSKVTTALIGLCWSSSQAESQTLILFCVRACSDVSPLSRHLPNTLVGSLHFDPRGEEEEEEAWRMDTFPVISKR